MSVKRRSTVPLYARDIQRFNRLLSIKRFTHVASCYEIFLEKKVCNVLGFHVFGRPNSTIKRNKHQKHVRPTEHVCKCARAYDSWKQCQWIIRTLNCKHKIWGKNWSYLRPYLKAFPVFNVLETWRVYLLTIGLGIAKFIKKISSDFLENAKFVGVDQITCKNCNKHSWMQVNKILPTHDRLEQFPSFFVHSFQWNQTTMRWSRVSKAYHFLKKLANCVVSMLFHCFYDA